jgi:intracellular septation protein
MWKLFADRHVIAELAPALIFFATNLGWGITFATIAAMVATALAVAFEYFTAQRLPWIAIATLAIVLIMGSMSLVLDDVRLVKMKPTVGKLLFAAVLVVGLAFRPMFLQRALGRLLYLTDRGWHVLTFLWVAFALAQAAANEVVWRYSSTDTWVLFKLILVPISITGYVLITRMTAPRWWDREAELAGADTSA